MVQLNEAMDVVYPYRRRFDELELRYSLRSLEENLPHRRVIIAGDRPRSVGAAATFVPVPRLGDRFQSSRRNIVAAVERAGVEGRFIVMNDDIFLLRPWKSARHHRGTIAQYLQKGASGGDYRRMVIRTLEILQAHGISQPLFYGLHTPTIYDSVLLLELVREFKGQHYLLRTLYCNLHPERSRARRDVKVNQWTGSPPARDVLSTADSCTRDQAFRAWISARFPRPSIYENGIASKQRN